MMGRKKKDPAEKRSRPLRIMTTESERQEIEKAAGAEDYETSTWVRRTILSLIRHGEPQKKK